METCDVLDAIHHVLEAHGIAAIRNPDDVCLIGHGLRFAASINDRKRVDELHQIVLAIHIHSDLLSVEPIDECFSGLARTRHEAVAEAFGSSLTVPSIPLSKRSLDMSATT